MLPVITKNKLLTLSYDTEQFFCENVEESSAYCSQMCDKVEIITISILVFVYFVIVYIYYIIILSLLLISLGFTFEVN